MVMKLGKFTLKDAKDICNWKYDGFYSIYNEPSWEEMVNTGRKLCFKKVRDSEYVKVLDDNNNYIGYGRIREVLGSYLIGVAMKPEYTGKWLGFEFVSTIIKNLHGRLVIEVREENKRAINCYKKVGFKVIDRKYYEDNYYLIMVLNKK